MEIDLPLGTYEMLCATGQVWYGRALLFGEDTIYTKSDELLDFYADGDIVYGWTITLDTYTDIGDELPYSTISPDLFQ